MPFLTVYHAKTCTQALQSLRQDLENAKTTTGPKKKFSFGRKTKNVKERAAMSQELPCVNPQISKQDAETDDNVDRINQMSITNKQRSNGGAQVIAGAGNLAGFGELQNTAR